MLKNYKTIIGTIAILILQCASVITKAQATTFQKVYPIAPNTSSINQSGRDILLTGDGGYLIAGMTTTTIAGDSDVYLMKTDNMGNIQWTQTYGGPQPDYIHNLVPTNDGNYFMLGFTMSYGGGGYDTWLIKMDASGTVLWSKTYGGSGNEVGHEIIPTADGNYMITGRASNDAYLMKIDPAGNVAWTKTYGGAQYDDLKSVKQCPDGNFVCTGQTFSYGHGGGDLFVLKTNSTGDTLWTRTYGGIYDDEAKYILANADGSIIVDGQISSSNQFAGLDINVIKLDMNGGTIWNKTYGGNDKDVTHMIQPTSDGGYIIAGISRSFGWINPNMWLVKTDGGGNTVWTQNYGSWYHDHCYAVKQTADGGYIALGHQEDVNNITHVFLVKTDASGQINVREFSPNVTFSVYPNPTSGIIKINLAQTNPSTTIRICNALGQTLFLETADNLGSEKRIDMRDKEPGVYFVSVQSGKELVTKKIVLK